MIHKGENYSVKLQKYFFAIEPNIQTKIITYNSRVNLCIGGFVIYVKERSQNIVLNHLTLIILPYLGVTVLSAIWTPAISS
jgi:hypothetical protein